MAEPTTGIGNAGKCCIAHRQCTLYVAAVEYVCMTAYGPP